LIAAALLVALAAVPEPTPAAPSGFARVAEPVIYYETAGSGAPVVLIHGGQMDRRMWDPQFESWSKQYRVVRYDVRGYGRSAVPTLPYSDVDDLLAVLDALGIARAHLVGHSLGGAIAQEVARAAPDRVASLTLIASAGLGPEIDIGYIEGFTAATGRRDLKPQLEKLFADSALVTRDMIDDVLKYKRLDGVDAALRAIAAASFPGGRQAVLSRDRLGGLRVPVQVIVGAKDRIIPADHANGLPGTVAVHRLENAGHMAHMEAAGEVNRLVEGFLAGVRAG